MTNVMEFESRGASESDGPSLDEQVRGRSSRRRGWRTGFASETVVENLEDPKIGSQIDRSVSERRCEKCDQSSCDPEQSVPLTFFENDSGEKFNESNWICGK